MERMKATATVAPNQDSTKVMKVKDIEKVLTFFRYTTGTTLDAMLSTGVLRNSITYYVRDLERLSLLCGVQKERSPH